MFEVLNKKNHTATYAKPIINFVGFNFLSRKSCIHLSIFLPKNPIPSKPSSYIFQISEF